MGEKLTLSEEVLPSANSHELAGSLEENHSVKDYSQTQLSQIEQKRQSEIELSEQKKADLDLNQKLSFFNEMVGENLLNDEDDLIKKNVNSENKEISTAERIKTFKEKLTAEGKSSEAILKMLINRFGKEKSVSLWVENWKNFLRLHQIAKSKPPQERKTLEIIISKADFSSATAFDTILEAIEQSSEVSAETKREIFEEFGTRQVDSVDQMDKELRDIKKQREKASILLKEKTNEVEKLDIEVQKLQKEIATLPVDDPKREKLQKQVEEKKQTLRETEKAILALEERRNKEVSFPLREGLTAKLNPDGSRSIVIKDLDFSIKLPTNNLPFMGKKNLRAINLAFPFRFLAKANVENLFFSPAMSHNAVPDKKNRDLGHLLLSSLGFNDARILSASDIAQMETDLARITRFSSMRSAKENLVELGVYDPIDQVINQEKLKAILHFTRENRGLSDKLFKEKLKLWKQEI